MAAGCSGVARNNRRESPARPIARPNRPLSRPATAPYSQSMDKVVFIAILVFMAVTLGILLTGLFSMARGGEFDKRNANKLMRWRVVAQGIAILLFIIFMMTWHHA